MEEQVGILAGKVWKFLSENGETDILKIKTYLKVNNSLLFLSIGWLLRESKIVIRSENNTYFIKLRD